MSISTQYTIIIDADDLEQIKLALSARHSWVLATANDTELIEQVEALDNMFANLELGVVNDLTA